MKSNWKQLMALLLVACMGLSLFCACATPQENPEGPGNQNTPPSTEIPDEGETVYKADIPAGYSAGGAEFNVYTYPKEIFVWYDYDWQNVGDINGDRINDAVFQRTSQVEQELDMTVVVTCGAQYADPTELKIAMGSGEDEFQIANVTMLNHINMVQSGYLHNLNDFGSIDLDAPWWDQNIQSDLAIRDMNFALTGDIGTMYKRSIAVIIFNKPMMRDIGEEDPYALIDSYEWTIETLVEMSQGVSRDLDSNDTWDENDRYGMIYFSDVLCAMLIGGGVNYATMEDDVPVLTLNCDDTINLINVASELLYDNELSYNNERSGQTEENMYRMFMGNQALFYYGELHSAEDMRRSEVDYGIMPMPLCDEYQKEYHHTVNPNVAAVIVVPKTNVNYDLTSYALDSLGAASKNILTPAYFDITLQDIVSRDEESAKTLELVIDTLNYDPGYLYLLDTGAMIRKLCNDESTNFVSSYKKLATPLQTAIDKIVEAIDSKY